MIIEDEHIAARRLKKMILSEWSDAEILNTSASVSASIHYLENHQHLLDIIFMDIQLSDGLAFNILTTINITTPIIFTTSYNEYEVQAYTKEAAAFLLKPIKRDQLIQAVVNSTTP